MLKFQLNLNNAIFLNITVHSKVINKKIFYNAECFAPEDVQASFNTPLPIFSFSFWRNEGNWNDVNDFIVSSQLEGEKIDNLIITVNQFLRKDLVMGIRTCESSLFE